MTYEMNDDYLQVGNPNEYPEYEGLMFSDLSQSQQLEYLEYSCEDEATLEDAEKKYDSDEEQELRMIQAEEEACDGVEWDYVGDW